MSDRSDPPMVEQPSGEGPPRTRESVPGEGPALREEPSPGQESSAGDEPPGPMAAVQRVAEGAGEVLDTARQASERIVDLSQPVVERVRTTAQGAARRWRSSRRSRLQHLRRLSREPLPNLFEIHPEARMAPRRELGLRSIPVDELEGTAVEGPAQRGGDFLPLPPFRSGNWVARWRRVRDALDRMAILPPIEVLKTADGYWVLDGHNRVAAALYGGQLEIDALVTAVRLPGEPADPLAAEQLPAGSLEAMLANADEVRAAGSGMLTPGASLEAAVHIPAPSAMDDTNRAPDTEAEPESEPESDRESAPEGDRHKAVEPSESPE